MGNRLECRSTRGALPTRLNNATEQLEIAEPLAPLQIEHIRPKKHRGTDEINNLALACIDCNLSKSSNVSGFDPDSIPIRTNSHYSSTPDYIAGATISCGKASSLWESLLKVARPLRYST